MVNMTDRYHSNNVSVDYRFWKHMSIETEKIESTASSGGTVSNLGKWVELGWMSKCRGRRERQETGYDFPILECACVCVCKYAGGGWELKEGVPLMVPPQPCPFIEKYPVAGPKTGNSFSPFWMECL